MNRSRACAAAFVLIAAALILASCAKPPTELRNDIASACIESRAEHNGYRDYCDIFRDCRAADVSRAASLRRDADRLCTPPGNESNRVAVLGIAAQIRSLGR